MKKLGKKLEGRQDTIKAYSCSCYSCSCDAGKCQSTYGTMSMTATQGANIQNYGTSYNPWNY